jgi:hypothetical protein
VKQHQQSHTGRRVITLRRARTSLNLVSHVHMRLILSTYVTSDPTTNIWWQTVNYSLTSMWCTNFAHFRRLNHYTVIAFSCHGREHLMTHRPPGRVPSRNMGGTGSPIWGNIQLDQRLTWIIEQGTPTMMSTKIGARSKNRKANSFSMC